MAGDSGPSWIVAALVLPAIAVLLGWAFVVGRNAHDAASAMEKAEIAQEDRRLCSALGLEELDGKYARCLGGLVEIRRRQKERLDAAIQ